MRCRTVLTRLDAMRTGELAVDERRAIEQHVATCPSCDQSRGDLVSLARQAKALFEAPPTSCLSAVERQLSDSFGHFRHEDAIVWVVFNDSGIRMLHLGGSESELRARHAKRFAAELRRGELPEALRIQVAKALDGEKVRDPLVDLREKNGPLERRVLETLMRIPRGQVRTYEWVARQIGSPRAVRAVGNVCAKNVLPFLIPCHRVVPSTGGVGNYLFGSAMKRELLRREGVDIEGLENLARQGVRFIGSRTTGIVCFPTCSDARRIRTGNKVAFRGATDAAEQGFRPCMKCQPFAA